MFSMMMIDASTIAPMATAMPPSDMMFAVRCCSNIGMNARSTPTGSVRIGMSALRAWSRKTKMMTLTTIISSMSVCRERGDRVFDQLRAVVRRDDRDARREGSAGSRGAAP